MPSLRFKGRSFVEHHHLQVPFHDLAGAEFVPAMSGIGMRFEIVDEAEWERRLRSLFRRPPSRE